MQRYIDMTQLTAITTALEELREENKQLRGDMIKMSEDHVEAQQKMVVYMDQMTNIKMELGFVAALAQ